MRSKWRSLAVWLAIACGCGGVAAPALAQTVASAGVTGTVRDSSDALVPGATVEIRNHSTNQIWQTVSDTHGRFRLPYLPVGDYHLSVQLSGFATTNAGLTLSVGDQVDVPIVLKPAAVSESVQVDAPTPLVEARRTEMAAVITPAEVNSLPLNGRNYLDLALLAPNVSRTNLRTTDRFAETSAVPGTGVSVSGQRNLNNNFVLDGLSANDDAADLAGVSLSQEGYANSRSSHPAAAPSLAAHPAERSASSPSRERIATPAVSMNSSGTTPLTRRTRWRRERIR